MAKKKAATTDIDISIPTKAPTAIAEGLQKLLADSYTLFLMTHNFHWNVTGLQFNSMHTMFETQLRSCSPQWTTLPSAFVRWASMHPARSGAFRIWPPCASRKPS